jgi:hypothetical protein
MPGGTGGIAQLQTMQGLGIARQSDYANLYEEYDSRALKELEKISPELAASLADVASLTDNPILDQATYQSGLQTQMLGYLDVIQNAILQVAKGEPIQNILGSELKAYTPQLTKEQNKRAKEIAERRAGEIKISTVQRQDNRRVNPNSPLEIEKRTVAARDQRRFEEWNRAGGLGLGPINDSISKNDLKMASQEDMIDPTLITTGAITKGIGLDTYYRKDRENFAIEQMLDPERNTLTDPREAIYRYKSYNPFSPITYDNAMERAGEPIRRSNQNINQQSNPTVNLGGINLNITPQAQISNEDFEQLKPKIEQLLQTEVPNMLIEIQGVKQSVSALGRTKETVDNLLSNGNFTQFAPPPKVR